MIVYPDFSAYGYQIIRTLGRNKAEGNTYLAYDNNHSQVVIKQFCFAEVNSSWQEFEAYQREISILKQIRHSRIPRYIDCFETKNGYGMVQEYKNAPSLETRNSFKPEEIKQILISVLEILVAIQNRLPFIVHNNLNPENILVDDCNNAYLVNFALARVNSQEASSTPEELFNCPITTASDLCSLGTTAIALITNTPSVVINNLTDKNYRFDFDSLEKKINPDFTRWLKKMVASNLARRYPDAASALQALMPINIVGNSLESKLKKQAVRFASIVMTTGFIYGAFQIDNNFVPKTIINNNSEIATLLPQQTPFNSYGYSSKAVSPKTPKEIGYIASRYALSGNINLAEKTIQQLPLHLRVYAARALFNDSYPEIATINSVNHKSVLAITNLVIKYESNNYIALYYGAMSAYALGEYRQAKCFLEQFLNVYQFSDLWQTKAQQTLKKIETL